MNNYDYQALPNMTEEQALHIAKQPYGTYPPNVTSQASSMMAIIQMRQQRNLKEGLEND